MTEMVAVEPLNILMYKLCMLRYGKLELSRIQETVPGGLPSLLQMRPTLQLSASIFHPSLKECIPSNSMIHCHGDLVDDVTELSFYKDIQDLEDDNSIGSTINHTSKPSKLNTFLEIPKSNKTFNVLNYANDALNTFQQDQIPLTVVNNIPVDKIRNQMSILKELIDSYQRNTNYGRPPFSIHYLEDAPYQYAPLSPSMIYNPISSESSTSDYKLNLNPSQLGKTNPRKKHINKLKTNVNKVSASLDSNTYAINPHDIATLLFKKYLNSNNNFMNNGEYTKKTSAAIPSTTKKSLFSTYNSVNNISKKNYSISQKGGFSFATYSNNTNELYKSCLNGTRLPNFNDCTRYFLCNTTYKCPPYTAFNKQKHVCDAAEYENCINRYPENLHADTMQIHNQVHCNTYMCASLQRNGDPKMSFNN
ncbi:hypothetical protein FQR65_LT00045 [Abscondita terminalis]|nr:hypothetical protein FQR65_LT00045 [Abscondita terminalis]